MAASPCPFSAMQCETLAQAKCQLINESSKDKWTCDDGDPLEFDEGTWRTEQIERLKNLVEDIPDHPSRESLLREYNQIRMTGLWSDGSMIISISRTQNAFVEVQAWWPQGGDDTSGLWFPFRAAFREGTMSNGAGVYDSGKLVVDLRPVDGEGAKVKMVLNEDGSASVHLWLKGIYNNESEYSFRVTRQAQGKMGSKPAGFTKNFLTNAFVGDWEGDVEAKWCNEVPDGKRKFRVGFQFNLLSLEMIETDISNPENPQLLYHQNLPLYQFDLYSTESTQRSLTDRKFLETSHSDQFGSDSIKTFEISEDGLKLKWSFDSSMFGGAIRCNIQGTLNRVK